MIGLQCLLIRYALIRVLQSCTLNILWKDYNIFLLPEFAFLRKSRKPSLASQASIDSDASVFDLESLLSEGERTPSKLADFRSNTQLFSTNPAKGSSPEPNRPPNGRGAKSAAATPVVRMHE
jgi:hypothetical protein